MNYREQYAKREAIQMYARDQDKAAVVAMLKQEGAGDAADTLADTYQNDFAIIQQHQSRQTQKSAAMYRTVGIVFLAGALAYGLLTYWAYGNGSFVALSGLTIIGAAALIKGLADKPR
jgi:hypothetical protein